jgi:hypothetical protein
MRIFLVFFLTALATFKAWVLASPFLAGATNETAQLDEIVRSQIQYSKPIQSGHIEIE